MAPQKFRWNPCPWAIHSAAMNPILFLLIFSLSSWAFASSGGSALHALHTVSKQEFAKGATIVEIKGVRGEPMPLEWTILMLDPSARGGVREVAVSSGRILSERAPLHGFTEVANLPPIDMERVSIDAGNVFQNVNFQASTLKMGFHWIDYTLRSDPQSMQPVWTVSLFDKLGSEIGKSRISADGGFVLEPLVNPAGEKNNKRIGGLVGRVIDFSESTGRKISDTTLRTIGNVQEFLVGERTVGPRDDE